MKALQLPPINIRKKVYHYEVLNKEGEVFITFTATVPHNNLTEINKQKTMDKDRYIKLIEVTSL